MPEIILTTFIEAPREICFDLARSIDLHLESMQHTDEKAIAGVTSGLICLNETVTWKAKHFGIMMKLTSRITECKPHKIFSDEMLEGPFESLTHLHIFKAVPGGTLMTDLFSYESPLGILGKLADWLFLKRYMQELLEQRNRTIKQQAEQINQKHNDDN